MVIETAKVVDPKARLSEAHRRLRLVQQASLDPLTSTSVLRLYRLDQDGDPSYMSMIYSSDEEQGCHSALRSDKAQPRPIIT